VPILHPLGCAIIVIQPDGHEYPDNQKDIDNYAFHYVMPIVHRLLSPQTTLENIYHKYYPRAKGDTGGSNFNKGLPESVIQYQIVEIPRIDSDPIEGCVFMFIGKQSIPSAGGASWITESTWLWVGHSRLFDMDVFCLIATGILSPISRCHWGGKAPRVHLAEQSAGPHACPHHAMNAVNVLHLVSKKSKYMKVFGEVFESARPLSRRQPSLSLSTR